ncbi:MAG: orotidine-5'-phosphate decarboxylase [Gammaproteobacteria bacterium]|nr:orotidine-5'-phosphate decarboxylase [Gammaproteobacteria bacterium]MCP5135854.1 orotidine-5'-phosphate decarboxylase [Gammaproteobacteria bacterium]
MNTTSSEPCVIVALDFPTADEALALASRVSPTLCRLKVGKELFTSAGPALIEALVSQGFDVFLDLKYHDIPTTVAKACKAAAQLGVWMINVHASGGPRMLDAARNAIDSSQHRPLLIGVTVLTSMAQEDLEAIGVIGTPEQAVTRLALLAKRSGLDGVVCSPLEVTRLRAELGKDFLLVTPGIRPAGTDAGDQKRIMTPAMAMAAGSSYLVIGRPITQAPDPIVALQAVAAELA